MTASTHDIRFMGTQTLLDWLGDEREIALVDVREEGEFGWGHPLHAINVPYSTLERDIVALVPRPTTRIVLIDDGERGVEIVGNVGVEARGVRVEIGVEQIAADASHDRGNVAPHARHVANRHARADEARGL